MPRLMNTGKLSGKSGQSGKTSRKKSGDGRKGNSRAGGVKRAMPGK